MLCPNCIEDLKITERQGIEIDYCVKCRGVWLDRGELDKIIERSLESLAGNRMQQPPVQYQQPPVQYEQPRYKEYKKKKSKKKKYKSLLEELFDFD